MDIDEARRIIKETDEKIARLFERRMEAVKEVSEYKKSHSLSVYDPEREAMLLENNLSKIESDEFRPYYTDVFKAITGVSKEYQNIVVSDAVRVSSPEGGYELFFDASIDRAGEYFDLDRKCLIVTDENVLPYAKRVAARCTFARVVTFPAGERTKCEESLHRLWSECCSFGMARGDCVVAVGGGVIGDLAGFAAATYMRGIDFYNVPTTVLSQVDSSVGGKCAIDFAGYKNIVGAFYDPKAVLIDPSVLETLDRRQFACGVAEAVKMAATFDAELFAKFEEKEKNYAQLIKEAVKIKIRVVERDRREGGLRRALNFGHTAAHAIESVSEFSDILHGEAVAIGMIPMAGGDARRRIKAVLEAEGLPTSLPCCAKRLTEAVYHDKKMTRDGIVCVVCPQIGKFEFVNLTPEEFERRITEAEI